jgi:hypothetical protein
MLESEDELDWSDGTLDSPAGPTYPDLTGPRSEEEETALQDVEEPVCNPTQTLTF